MSTKVELRPADDGEQEVADELGRVRAELTGVQAEITAAHQKLATIDVETATFKRGLYLGPVTWRPAIFAMIAGAALSIGALQFLFHRVDLPHRSPPESGPYRPPPGYQPPPGMPVVPPR